VAKCSPRSLNRLETSGAAVTEVAEPELEGAPKDTVPRLLNPSAEAAALTAIPRANAEAIAIEFFISLSPVVKPVCRIFVQFYAALFHTDAGQLN
jgi:hypothetical protein